jgi:hypothetical protein
MDRNVFQSRHAPTRHLHPNHTNPTCLQKPWPWGALLGMTTIAGHPLKHGFHAMLASFPNKIVLPNLPLTKDSYHQPAVLPGM